MFISFQDFVGKTNLAEKREILKFGHKWNLILEICLLVNCLSPVTSEHCIFQTVTYLWIEGIRRIE